ncbi:ankyrin repeat domain-containing protein [Planococcus kocurii]|uniref:ankyrin repeat domain-containing protein n=1 Tax=Planococcus kocurii TaxID=1374 RepID=UPI003CFBEB73
MNDIFEAILTKDLFLLSQILNAGCDVNVQDEDGRTALMEAVIDNNVEIVKLLIQFGADVNKQDYLAETSALHFAAQNNSSELVELLLENQAEVELEDVHGNTPLSDAVFNSRGEGDVIKILLLHGSDQNKKNKHGISPLNLAESIANYNIINYFK